MTGSVAVVGPGSIGAYLAAQLAAVGRDPVACARRGFREYVIESSGGTLRAPARVVTDPDELRATDAPAEWVLLAVKAHQTAAAAGWLARLCDATTTVVVLQNGVEGEEAVAPLVGAASVLPSVLYIGARLDSPGRVKHGEASRVIVPRRPASAGLRRLFDGTPVEIEISDAYQRDAWRKLGVNVVSNGITALTRHPLAVMRRPDVAEVGRQLLEECWRVGRAEGADLGEADVAATIALLQGASPGLGSSMYYDRMAGRPTEHDALYGAVVRAGLRHGIHTPLAALMQALLAAGDPSPEQTSG